MGTVEGPVVLPPVWTFAQSIEEHPQIGEGVHERLRGSGDFFSPDGGRAVVNRERPVLGVMPGHLSRIVAAPGCGVPLGEVPGCSSVHGVSRLAAVAVDVIVALSACL